MKGYFCASKISKFYTLFSIFLIIVMLFGSLPPITSKALAKPLPVAPTVAPKLLTYAPVANDDTYAVNQGGTLDVTAPGVLGNDTDADNDPLTAIKVSDPAHGTLTLNADGSFAYIHDGSDTTSDFFTYKANDGTADSNEATVNITVNPLTPINSAPVANDDTYAVNQGGTLDVTAPGVLGNDTDADNDPLTTIKVSDPAHGTLTLNADGSFAYIHDGSDTTSDLFTYKANDGTADSNEATVNITVNPAIAPPTITNSTGASNITANSAILNGEILNTGGENPTVHIYWGDNDGGITPGNWDHDEDLGAKGLGAFSKTIVGLNPGTTYYYLCFATNSGGAGWANSASTFTTQTLKRLIGADDATAAGSASAGYFVLSRFTAVATGSITQFKLKSSGSCNVKVALYSDSNGQPAELMNAVNTSTVAVSGWNTITFPATSVTSGASYWLAFDSDVSRVGYLGSGGTCKYRAATYSSFTFPDSAGSGFTDSPALLLVAGWGPQGLAAPVVSNYGGAGNVTAMSAKLNGNLISTGGENPTVHIYWGDNDGGTNAANWDHDINLGTEGLGTFYTNMSGMAPNTTCYYRCYATNSSGSAWAYSTTSFKTSPLSPPSVTNSTGATNITANSATINGEIIGTGGENPTVHIYWGDNDGGTSAASWDHDLNLGTKSLGTFHADLTGLTPDTEYFYRCFAQNYAGTSWTGDTASFTTIAAVSTPTLTNATGATNTTPTSARLNGELTSTGDEYPIVHIYWGNTDGGTDNTSWTNDINLGTKSLGTFYADLTGLTPDTTYYYRCFAQNSAGYAWSDNISFITAYAAPVITNTFPSNMTATSARLNGELTSTGGENPTVHIYWGDTDGGTDNTSWDNDINLGIRSTGLFYTDISGLSENTACYYRCFAQNSASVAWAPATTSFPAKNLQKLVGANDVAPTADDVTLTYSYDSNQLLLIKYTAESYGTLRMIRLRCTTGGNVKVAIYADSNGEPASLLSANNNSTPVSAGWNAIYLKPVQITRGNAYWLACISNSNGVASLYYSGIVYAPMWRKYTTYSGFSFPDSAGTSYGSFSTSGYLLIDGWGTLFVDTPIITNATGASYITSTTARLNGEQASTGNENSTVHIYWGDTDGGTDPASWANDVELGTLETGTFYTDISGLTPDVTYYYRCLAHNSTGDVWSDSTSSFITVLTAPTITNTFASNITTTSCRLNGELTSTGGENPTTHIYWGDTDGGTDPASWDYDINLGIRPTGHFSTDITALSENTTYYYRCFAQNSTGSAWAPATTSFPAKNLQKLIGYDDATPTGSYPGNVLTLICLPAEYSGTLSQIKVKCISRGHVKVAIYTDFNISPANLLSANNDSTPVSAGWNTIYLNPVQITKGTAYWLASVSDSYCIAYCRGAGINICKDTTYSNFSFPANAGAGYSSNYMSDYLLAGWGTVTTDALIVTNATGASDIIATSARLNGELTYTSSENTTAHIYWGDNDGGADPSSWDNDVNLGTLGLGAFYTDITGLNPDTTYYYRCFAQNCAGASWASDTASFTTIVATSTPTLTNAAGATNITAASARLNGELTSTGGENPYVTILWGDSDSGTDYYSWANHMELGILETGTFSTDISGLTPDTTYYYRCLAENGLGAGWSDNTSSFTTVLTTPTITNTLPSNITATSSRLNGELTSTGGDSTTVHIYWGDSDGSTNSASWANDINLGILDTGAFSTDVSGLNSNTIYYYRCLAQNSIGSVWSDNTSSFITVLTTPTVTNTFPSNITATSARLNGELTSTGGENPTVHIYWGDGDGGTDSASWANDINLGTLDGGTFYTDITGLTPDTTYYYRCFAQNSAGSAWSPDTTSFPAKDLLKLAGADDGTPTFVIFSNLLCVTRYTAEYSGTLRQIKVKRNNTGNVKMAIYADGGFGPAALLSANNNGTSVVTGWNTIDINPIQITRGTSYWLALISDSLDNCGLYKTDNNSVFYGWVTYDGFSFPVDVRTEVDMPANNNISPVIAGWGTISVIVPILNNATGASNITATSARLNGELTSTGGENPTIHIYWGDTDGGTDPSTWAHNVNLGNPGLGAFHTDIADLTINVTYYYRCFAQNSAGSAWADTASSFITVLTTPTITNTFASNITTSSARLNGELTSTGGENPTIHIYWGNIDGGTNPASWTNDVNLGILGAGNFYTDIAGLTPNVTYYYRCFAQNSAGSAWAPATIPIYPRSETQKLFGAVDLYKGCSTWAGGSLVLSRQIAEYSGTIRQIQVGGYINTYGNVKAAIYADSNGQPGNLLSANNNSTPVSDTFSGWNTIYIDPVQITRGSAYWLAFISDTSCVHYDWIQGETSLTWYTSYYGNIDYNGFSFPASAETSKFDYSSSTIYNFLLAGWGTIAIDAPIVSNATGASNVNATTARLNGELTSTGGENPTIHIYWGNTDGGTNPASWANDVNLGILGAGAFYKDIVGLTPNVTYYYRCFARNSAGSAWSVSTSYFIAIFTAPTITNALPRNITATSARLNGELTSTGGENPTVHIYWGDTDGGTDNISWDYDINLGIRPTGPFYSDISALSENTTYYYRCFAQNAAGSAWALNTTSFPAKNLQKLIGADDVTTTALLSGGAFYLSRYTSDYSGTLRQIKVRCGSSGNVKVAVYTENNGDPADLLSANNTGAPVSAGWNIIDLNPVQITRGAAYWLAFISNADCVCYYSSIPGDTYYYVQYANYNDFSFPASVGINNIYSQATKPILAGWGTMTTDALIVTNATGASDITATSARLNGELTYTSSENTTAHIYWGDNDGGTNPDNWDHNVNLGTLEAGTFHTGITGLTIDTTYYYRCYASNSTGSDWAYTTNSFKTGILSPPAVTNADFSYINASSVRLNGEIHNTGGENSIVHIYWGDNDGGTNPVNWDHDVNLGTLGAGTFYTDVTGLTPYATYYYRCFAQNYAGTYWAPSTSTIVAGSKKLIGAEDDTSVEAGMQQNFYLIKYTADSTGMLRQIKVSCISSGHVKVAIYSNDNGHPDSLLSANNNGAPVSEGWNIIDISPVQITGGTNYWLAFISDLPCVAAYFVDNGPTVNKYATYSSFSFPASAGTDFSSNPYRSYILAGYGVPPDSNSTATEETSNQTNLTETLMEQTLAINNIAVTGDLSGTFAFTDFKMVGVKTGSFANEGFFKAEWQANLEGLDYTGNCQGMFFLNQDENRIYLKGNASGGITGIVDGYFTESVAGSGTYDQFQIDLQFSQLDTKAASGTASLNGTAAYQASQEYPSTQLYVLQTSLVGTSSGDYIGALDVVITHLRVSDNNTPYYGQGFSIISYTTDTGSGTGYTYDKLDSPGQVTLSGMFSRPLLGIVSGVLDESISPRTLSIRIERVDSGAPPNADLTVSVWSQQRVSPGQTVTYTIEYRNDGLKAATNAVVFDTLDFAVLYESASDGAYYDIYNHEVSWDLGALPAKGHGYLTVTTKIIWGLPQNLPLENRAYILDMIHHSSEENRFCNGIGLDSKSDNETFVYTTFAKSINAKWIHLYEDSELFGGALEAYAASQNYPTPTNGVGDGKKYRTDVLGPAPMWSGYSGGTTTTVTQSLNKLISGNMLYLISPQLVSPDKLNKIVTGKDKVFQRIMVLQGDDLMAPWQSWGAYIGKLVAQNVLLPPPLKGILLTRVHLLALSVYYPNLRKVINEIDAAEHRPLLSLSFIPYPVNRIIMVFPGKIVNTKMTYTISGTDRIGVINATKINHGDWIKALILFVSKYGRLPLTTDDQPRLQKIIDHLAALWEQFVSIAKDPNYLSVSPQGYIKPGDTLAYTIDYENEGEGIAYGVYITDTLTEDLDTSTLSINDGGIYDPQTRTIEWFIGEVQSKQKGSVSFSVNTKADAPDGTQIINYATVYFPSVPEETRTNSTISTVMLHPQQITVNTYMGLVTTEAGGTATFDVTLTHEPTANVVINLSSDNPSEGIVSPTSLTFTPNDWNLTQSVTVTGVSDNVVDGNVTYHIITAPAVSTDPGYNGLDPDDVTVVNVDLTSVDNIPPTTQIQVTPIANENGWNNSDITVNLSASDNESGSGVKEIHYQLSDAMQEEQTVSGTSASFTVSIEGITTLNYYAIDNAGNQEAEQSVTLRLDKTAPTITDSSSPLPNSNGWNNSDVTVTFSASDNLSGIESCTGPITVSAEGVSQNLTGDAADLAGNKATASVTVSIDKTPPIIAASASPQPNPNGWNNTDVVVHFTASDTISDIDIVTPDTVISAEGAGQSVTGTATDKAGNSATATVLGINIDKTPPAVNIISPQAKEYLASDNITLDFAATDNLSNISSIQATLNGLPVTNGQVINLSAMEGIFTLTVQASDKADNSASTQVTFTVNSAKALKNGAVSKLNSAKTGNKKVDETIDLAIRRINNSLDAGLWLDSSHLVYGPKIDWLRGQFDRFGKQGKTVDDEDIDDDNRIGTQSLPSAKNGITVFHQEMLAVMLLQTNVEVYGKAIPILENQIKTKQPRGHDVNKDKAELDAMKKALPVFQEVIADLVKADMILAKVAIDDARNKPITNPAMNKIVSREIETADKEFAEAMKAANKGQAAIALTRFSHAWFHAQLAIKFAALEPKHP